LEEKKEEKDRDGERQIGEERKTRLDSELKKTRIEIPGLYWSTYIHVRLALKRSLN
jgi:hypothetical protein